MLWWTKLWRQVFAWIHGDERLGAAALRDYTAEPVESRVLLAALMPDLIPWANQSKNLVYGWSLDTTTQPGRTLLRLSNAVANVGVGPFEVIGSTVNADGSQNVLQRVYNSAGDPTPYTDYLAGKFVYHPSHNHTHFEGLAQYNLRAVTPGDGVGGLVAGGNKTSFCLVDTLTYPNVPNTPSSAVYVTCTTTRQGISVGWADIYDKSLPDQWIDVTGVPGGRYWLEVVADPDNHVLENNETNNVTRILIDLPGATGPVFSQTQVAGSLSNATAMEFSPDGKMFVTEQAGTMEVWQNGTRLQADFFRDTPLVTQTTNERGLLGVAFDPNFASNRFVYVYYTTTAADNHNRVSRFTANATGDLALAGSEQILLELDPHSSAYHQGGAIHFGGDGKLYIATGDDGNQDNGTSVHNSQRLDSLHGKVLRINPDGTIPTDNPFYNQATGKYRSIWALGFRNPFTFAVQPGTGRIFVNDVGETSWEEIDDGAAGANYGWPTTEGDFSQATYPNFTRPFYTYPHSGGTVSGCAISGGAFYNPVSNQFGADYLGDYFFGDYCANKIFRVDTATKSVTDFITPPGGVGSLVDVHVDRDGNLYYLARNSGAGQIFRVSVAGATAPSITQQPADQTAAIGQAVSFSVTASGPGLNYQWQRAPVSNPGSFTDIGGANASSYTIDSAATTDNGSRFRVVVSNAYGSAVSNAATLTVTSNHVPVPVINLPAAGSTYVAGQQVTFSGSASDQEDGASLPASAFSWEVRFYHNDSNLHYHPFQTFPLTTGGSFTIPNTGETSPNVWYELLLTVTDSQGASATVHRDILPQTVTVTLGTNPAGLALTLDGQPAPASFVGVVGMQRTLGAPLNQISTGGAGYIFDSWSDGGAATHTITTPGVNTTYTARYNPGAVPGLKSEFFNFDNTFDFIPNLTGLTPDITRTDSQINFPVTSAGGFWSGLDSRFVETFASRHSGYLRVDTAGSYTFYLNSNDGSKLYIDNQLIVDNDGRHGMLEKSGAATLSAGYHALRVEFHQALNTCGLILSWSGPGISKQVIPASVYAASLPPGQAPRVKSAATAKPSPVTGKTANLSVLGNDDGGEANLTYTWSASGPAAVTFSANGTNAAKATVATFSRAGAYSITATIRDATGLTAASTVKVSVNQTLTSITVTPASATLQPNAQQAFSATARDQFGNAITAPIIWSLDGGSVGTLSSSGLYTAPATTGSATVRATSGAVSATASVSVTVQSGPPAFQQDSGPDGLVVMEAENYDGITSVGGKSWTPYTATSGYSGTGTMQATPNTDILINTGYVTQSPRLDYRVNFTKTGTYYVWIRGLGFTGNDDTVHVGLDGAAVATSDRLGSFPSTYGWTRNTLDGVVATITVTTTGVHTINLWMREDGAIIDKILLTTNASYVPAGTGPAQSPRA